MDETGHSRDGHRHWLWHISSQTAAYFAIFPSRGKKIVKRLMSDFNNILISDRYNAYNYFDSSRRQFCWTHLKRDFKRFSERKEITVRRIGKELLKHESKLFEVWHEFRSSKITRNDLIKQIEPIRYVLGECLEKGSYTAPELRLSGFCKNLLENFDALWTFVEKDDVEPTNNHAERGLRPWVIWRKKYFCARSDYGSEFVARTASTIVTCRLKSQSPFEYVVQALRNHFCGDPAPPIIIDQ